MRSIIFILLLLSIVISAQKLENISFSQNQWTGIAVSHSGRIFVNYPRWSNHVPISVAELLPDGTVKPYPDPVWNSWQAGCDPQKRFVCVQSVYIDDQNYLWILDPANPGFRGVIAEGPKLLKVRLSDNKILSIFSFESVIAQNSYLNDIRIDTRKNIAYISDSGFGAIVVLDLSTGKARRMLADHPGVKSEKITLTIGEKPWLLDGNSPRVHSDGIALSPDRKYIYFQALTARNLYRIETEFLLNEKLSSEQVSKKVEFVAASGASDGIIFDKNGHLYLSSLEHDAIRYLTPDHKLHTLIADKSIAWPDSFSIRGNFLYFTTARIHLGKGPYGIHRIPLRKVPYAERSKAELMRFVYHWFSLFDANADIDQYLSLLAENVIIDFPDKKIRNHADFADWYNGILKNVKKAEHYLEHLEIKSRGNSKYLVELVVLWLGTQHDGSRIEFRAHQSWLIEDSGELRITHYFVREAGFVHNTTKALLRMKQPVFGGFATIADAKIIENMAASGKLDFIWIEAEHSEFGPKATQLLTMACENEKVTPIVRVPINDLDHIKKYIGTGVQGVVVPAVKNAKEVEQAVKAIKYAPQGNRPAGVERGNRYLSRFSQYKQEANDQILAIIMIETKEAIADIENIVKVKGIDILHVGPYDLSLSMGVAMNSPELAEALQIVERVAEKQGIALGGYAPTRKNAFEKQKRGYLFFTVPGDMELLQKGIKNYFSTK